jgi:alpha-glucosidase
MLTKTRFLKDIYWIMVWAALLPLNAMYSAESMVSSPDGSIRASVVFDESRGKASYSVKSGEAAVIESSPMGLTTDLGDFTQGMSLVQTTTQVIHETYILPVGKRSTYVNHANELVLHLKKDLQDVRFRFRAYNDGIAFSYVVEGSGSIAISMEISAFKLSAGGSVKYWGQNHPNNYGYENMLGQIEGDRMSIPVLAELKDMKHFIFMAQAASYGTYVVPNLKRDGRQFNFSFPMDQTDPVRTELPFQSPWRVAIISPVDLGTIVESTMLENLNPPTEPELVNADWIKGGRVSWDYLAGDRDKPKQWVDFDVQMGWEYHLVDAGFERRFDVEEATRYARENNVQIIGWGYTPRLNTREKAEEALGRYAGMGLRGAKLDFFDHHPFVENKRTNDFEDTQASLQMRDYFMEIAAEKHLLLEFHGCTLPTGERRRYPHFMTAEGVAGMEKRNPRIENDLTIPYVRNIMGPVSFTVVKFDRSIGSQAYQMGQCVVYEAGLQIYAERHDKLLAFKGVDFLKKVPSAWDETRFINGYPETHAIFARRKAQDWYIGGITNQPRLARIQLDFLAKGRSYRAHIYKDGNTKEDIVIERKTVAHNDRLDISMLHNGGFAVCMIPID